jgi:branched-chain amino acid transport system substrate-binding protein
VFAPLDSKDYSMFFGQIRAARPDVFYTSVGGNDSVRLFTQMEEYGLKKSLIMIGAASVITPQTIGSMGAKVAEGFVTGVGYSPELDTPENKAFVAKFRAAYKTDPDLYAADSYGVIYFYKHAVEKAKSTQTDAVRTAMRGLVWDTPQGKKTMRAGDHQGIQDMYAVKVVNGQFKIIGKVSGEVAVGPDTCTRF